MQELNFCTDVYKRIYPLKRFSSFLFSIILHSPRASQVVPIKRNDDGKLETRWPNDQSLTLSQIYITFRDNKVNVGTVRAKAVFSIRDCYKSAPYSQPDLHLHCASPSFVFVGSSRADHKLASSPFLRQFISVMTTDMSLPKCEFDAPICRPNSARVIKLL